MPVGTNWLVDEASARTRTRTRWYGVGYLLGSR